MINYDKMYDRLPSSMKDSEVLCLQSKKVLAALLELLLHSKAKETGIIYTTNRMLRRLAGIKSNDLLNGLNELQDYNLITRKVGEKGHSGVASEYTIDLEAIQQPIQPLTFEELFDKFNKII